MGYSLYFAFKFKEKMASGERPLLIVGNWKMYKTLSEGEAFVRKLLPQVPNGNPRVYLAVPFTAIKPLSDICQGTSLVIGAQNMHDANEGAFTGEIAGRMLKEAGARFVILGHSERRHLFHESDEFINRKVKRAVSEGIQPLLCIGESLKDREEGNTLKTLRDQLCRCLSDIKTENLLLAYEPVWAIGSNIVATPAMIEEAHGLCREVLKDIFGEELAKRIPILYGGSVNDTNARSLIEEANVDGLLVGGASLNVDSFSKIVHYNQMRVNL